MVRSTTLSTSQKILIGTTVPLISLCITFLLLYFITPQNDVPVRSETPLAVQNATSQPDTIAAPTTLKIESITVAAPIYPVGLTPEGDMDITEDPMQTAWYEPGPKPGEVGSAVIAGHYGWKNGVPSLFNELNTLKPGAEIKIVAEDDKELTFAVTHIENYSYKDDATEVFRSNDGKAHLNLITCQGEWNKGLSTYSERYVVFTELVTKM